MANEITLKALQDASLDAKSLEEVVNGDDAKQVTTRLGENYPSVKKAINIMFQNGGLPAAPFATKALMESSALADGYYAQITDDGSDNGLYLKTAGSWVKSSYDPLGQSKEIIDSLSLGYIDGLVRPDQIASGTIILRPFMEGNYLSGHYVGDSGLVAFSGTNVSGFIKLTSGASLHFSDSATFVFGIYDNNKNFIKVVKGTENIPQSFTITEPNAAYVRINFPTPEALAAAGETAPIVSITPAKHELSWLKASVDNIYDAVSEIFATQINNTNLLTGVSLTLGKYLGDDGIAYDFSGYNYSDYIAIKPDTSYIISFAGQFVGVFYSADKVMIDSIPPSTGAGTTDYEFVTPSGAAYIRVNISNEDLVRSLRERNERGIELNVLPQSNWKGKKIAWYGTSIPAGYPKQSNQDAWSHANLAVHDLGAEIINKCVPAGGISLTTALSFVRLTDAINYQNSLVDLIGTALNPDLVVFDYGVNDYDQSKSDIDAFDPNDPLDSAATGTKTKIDTRNTSMFIGAYNTVIDAMLTKNPSIKFCFITHFSDDNASPNISKKADFFAQMNIVIEAIAKYWGAPVLRLHTKTNYRNRNGFNSITPAMPDHIHPASGDGSSVESLRAIIRDFLMSIG